jgi:hypothetical protein
MDNGNRNVCAVVLGCGWCIGAGSACAEHVVCVRVARKKRKQSVAEDRQNDNTASVLCGEVLLTNKHSPWQ